MPAKKSSPKPVPHVHYHKDGSLYGRGELTNGEMTGFWEFFRKDGSVMRSGAFDAGVQVGDWTTYDRVGAIVKVTTMKSPTTGTPPARKSKR